MRKQALILSLLVLLAPAAAIADDEKDHERALRAVRHGELLPLETILRMHPLGRGERLIEVELDRKGRRWEYELEILGPDGRVRELEIDGATGRILDED